MSHTQSTYQERSQFKGSRNGIIIYPQEIKQYFRAIRIGQTIDVKEGYFQGKSFKVSGKSSSVEQNFLLVDPASEQPTSRHLSH